MVSEYTGEFYLPAHQRFHRLEAEDAMQAEVSRRSSAASRRDGPQVRIEAVEDGPGQALPVGMLDEGARAHPLGRADAGGCGRSTLPLPRRRRARSSMRRPPS